MNWLRRKWTAIEYWWVCYQISRIARGKRKMGGLKAARFDEDNHQTIVIP